jgi:propionyl-CoA carboxylase beta chain
MNSKHLSGDVNYAWANAEIAVMGPEGAVEIIFREEAKNQDLKAKKVQEYREKFTTPFVASSRGFIDEVIRPQNTRKHICTALQILKKKKVVKPWKKHDNLPL